MEVCGDVRLLFSKIVSGAISFASEEYETGFRGIGKIPGRLVKKIALVFIIHAVVRKRCNILVHTRV